jgi:hypothetical protein
VDQFYQGYRLMVLSVIASISLTLWLNSLKVTRILCSFSNGAPLYVRELASDMYSAYVRPIPICLPPRWKHTENHNCYRQNDENSDQFPHAYKACGKTA